MELNKNYLVPVQQVSVDHFHSAILVHLYHSKRHSDYKDIFRCGFILVDHTSGYIQFWHQFTCSANETVKSTLIYKRDAANYVVCIQAYHTDNGVFTSKDLWVH